MINKILIEIADEKSIYSDIMDNILYPNTNLKQELISELAISFIPNKEKIEKAYKEGWFKYLFIKAVKNQVHSKTSPFHKNVRQSINKNNGTTEFKMDMVMSDQEDQDDIDYKKEKELQLINLNSARKEIKLSWYESEVLRLYYDENMTLRAIEEHYSIDHCSVFHTVKKIRQRLTKELEKPKYKI